MRTYLPVAISLIVLLLAFDRSPAQHLHDNMKRNASHYVGVDGRGDQAMGFDHTKTAHHFLLFRDGGAIEVQANDPKDTQSRDAIRRHLRMIRNMFAAGNFDLPMFIHATAPPGMPTLKRLRKQITYTYTPTPEGAQIRLRSKKPQAITAIHQFLRFQIQEHRTGDSLSVQP